MAGKKYFWLKLKKDFFKRHDIQIIESMPNGKDYILFYLKMLLESVDHNGNLRFSDVIPYNESMLATITNTNVDIVKSAMTVFTELKMIDILDDQTIFMAEVEKMLGTEGKSTERVAKFRENRKLICERKIPNIENHINNKRYGGNYYKVLERDNYSCSSCGNIEKIMVHHIIPYNPDDDDTLRIENLVTLCSSCHTTLHNASKNRKLGLLPGQTILDKVGFDETLMKRYRNVSKQYIEIDIELDKELDIEIDKDKQSSPSAFKFYENERFGILTPFIADKIGNWIDDTSEEVVIKALEIAVSNDKRTWKYAEAILQSWYTKGLKTITDIEAQEKEYERQKLNKQQSYKQKGKQEIIPEFMQPGYVEPDEYQKTDEEVAKFEAELELLMKGGK